MSVLKLNNINKTFKLENGEEFNALKDINLEFSKGEFVSIIGQSGSGKSTLLNLIAGLDFPTSGELIIGDKTSKKFKKKDWDLYRKNNIGFIFQNFNLIEHLTALENVEIVMNLIGLNYSKRKKRAAELLKKVGLENHMHHRPSELSGGQKQRVAVARALANDPDIILADEPTGALDSKTSTQIMELIKSVAKDKLIIMVTHNNKLADTYSSRLIKIKDGKIQSDENIKEQETNNNTSELNKKDRSMSFFEAIKLSFRNMSKKKGRVFITTIAGCIGIIGFTLITGLGNGANIYIDKQLNKFATANVLVLSSNVKNEDSNEVTPTKDKKDYDKILNDEYIKENTVDTRTYIPLNTSNISVKDKDNKDVVKKFMPFCLASDNNLEFLKENVDGKIPTEGKNEILLNQVSAKSILKTKEIDSDDAKDAIGETVKLSITIPNTNLKYDKDFVVSGISNEIDLGMPTIYFNYNDILNYTKSIDVFGKSLYDLLTENPVYEITVKDVNETQKISNYICQPENGGNGKVSIIDMSKAEPGNTATNMSGVIKNIFAQLILMAQVIISIFIVIALIVSSIMTSIVLYSSIIERKTEIGIIKAVGGRNKDVIRIFESEAILMGVFSGVLGLVISFITAPILEDIVSKALNLNLPGIVTIPLHTIPFTNIVFPFATIISIIAFSSLISFLAGYLPSRKATKMHVIDALRDE